MRMIKYIATLLLCLSVQSFAQNISVGTGGTGGVYYPMGGGLASILSKYVSGMSATAEVTGGSVDNLNLIGTGKPYVGFTMADAAFDAIQGTGKFTNRKTEIRNLLVLYPNRMHVVTVESTGIKTIKDIKGKRISTGSPGSATEVMALRVLEAAGLEKGRDYQNERLSVAESVNAIKDRKIDAFFWVGGLPTAGVTDLANSPGNKIVMIDNDDEVAAMNKKYGNLYYTDVIPKSMYSGMQKDNKVSAVANMLVVNATMPDDQAYKIVKAIFDHQKELVATHTEYSNVNLASQKLVNSSVPFHPGAIKYLKEQGVKF
ncbi:MAG: TAXI family TRAP transporter solute-binding subunit [Betaproteobacteria bacterium]